VSHYVVVILSFDLYILIQYHSSMFKVLTCNIRFDNPDDGANQWKFRKDFLTLKLNELNLDFIGTQEGREPQLREFESLLNDFKIEDNCREWISERMYPCLLYNSHYQIRNSGDIWLSTTPQVAGSKDFDSAFPRLATWLRVDKFLLVNLHLDHTKDSTRFSQIKVLCEEIKKIRKSLEPLVVMGDFNSDYQSEVHQYVCKELGLTDPWIELKKPEETSFHHFKGTIDNGARIDWILHSQDFTVREIKLLKENKGGVYLSDHYPVYCEIELK